MLDAVVGWIRKWVCQNLTWYVRNLLYSILVSYMLVNFDTSNFFDFFDFFVKLLHRFRLFLKIGSSVVSVLESHFESIIIILIMLVLLFGCFEQYSS
jgi:hypothetical protein